MRGTEISRHVEAFSGSWPDVLSDMQEFVELSFLAAGTKRRAANIRVLIARPLVPSSHLQPHIAHFRQAISAVPSCRIELRSTDQTVHTIEIEYRR